MKEDFKDSAFAPDRKKFPQFTKLMDFAREAGVIGDNGPNETIEQHLLKTSYHSYAHLAETRLDGDAAYKDQIAVFAVLSTGTPVLRDALGPRVLEYGYDAATLVKRFNSGMTVFPLEKQYAQASMICLVSWMGEQLERVRTESLSLPDAFDLHGEVMEIPFATQERILPDLQAPRLAKFYSQTLTELVNETKVAVMACELEQRGSKITPSTGN